MKPLIKTYTGRWFNLVDPQPEQVDIRDIAHALSNICRFTGHTPTFYPVAAHSMRVAELVGKPHQLVALLHDAQEAYISDINSPLKQTDAMAGYRLLENRIWSVIAEVYKLPSELPEEVREADHLALWEEARDPELSGIQTKWTATLGVGFNRHPEWVEQAFLRAFFEELHKGHPEHNNVANLNALKEWMDGKSEKHASESRQAGTDAKADQGRADGGTGHGGQGAGGTGDVS